MDYKWNLLWLLCHSSKNWRLRNFRSFYAINWKIRRFIHYILYIFIFKNIEYIKYNLGLSTKVIKTSYSSAAGTAYITYDNVKVPVENLLGY